jgi:hypothetical protein
MHRFSSSSSYLQTLVSGISNVNAAASMQHTPRQTNVSLISCTAPCSVDDNKTINQEQHEGGSCAAPTTDCTLPLGPRRIHLLVITATDFSLKYQAAGCYRCTTAVWHASAGCSSASAQLACQLPCTAHLQLKQLVETQMFTGRSGQP